MSPLFPWQTATWQQITKQLSQLPHALLFTGPEGVGKRHFVQTLAKALLCQQPQQHVLPCGHCHQCQLIAAGNHPDLLQLHPDKPGQMVKIDAIRQLIAFNALSSYSQQAKITIIAPGDAMNIAASNALLKTLEAPSDNCYIILVSAKPHHLLATIQSRCQRIALPLPPRQHALTWLQQQGVEQSSSLLLDLACGAPLKAKQLYQEGAIGQRAQLFEQWCQFGQACIDLPTISEQWEQLDLKMVLWHLKTWIGDIIRLKLVAPSSHLINQDLRPHLANWAKQCASPPLFHYLDTLYQADKQFALHPTLNKRLFIENLLILWLNTSKEKQNVS